MLKKIKHLWHILRRLTGDDAYDVYLKHHMEFHQSTLDTPSALSRKEFFKLWQDTKWKGIKRCC